MNIFVLDTNPEMAARFHNDRHVTKMILESCQLLATAHHVYDGSSHWQDPDLVSLRPTHMNHPCQLWTQRSTNNYRWLWRLTAALMAEFASRYGHLHSFDGVIIHALTDPPRNMFRRDLRRLTAWPQCMPECYKVPNDPVLAYRRYYYGAKQHLAHWRAPAVPPAWWNEMAMDKSITIMTGTEKYDVR